MMNQQDIVESIDREISRLQHARELLASMTGEVSRRGPGRPKGATKQDTIASLRPEKAGKRQLTAEGKQRIADAQKARWAAKRSGAGSQAVTEEVTATEPSNESLAEV